MQVVNGTDFLLPCYPYSFSSCPLNGSPLLQPLPSTITKCRRVIGPCLHYPGQGVRPNSSGPTTRVFSKSPLDLRSFNNPCNGLIDDWAFRSWSILKLWCWFSGQLPSRLGQVSSTNLPPLSTNLRGHQLVHRISVYWGFFINKPLQFPGSFGLRFWTPFNFRKQMTHLIGKFIIPDRCFFPTRLICPHLYHHFEWMKSKVLCWADRLLSDFDMATGHASAFSWFAGLEIELSVQSTIFKVIYACRGQAPPPYQHHMRPGIITVFWAQS